MIIGTAGHIDHGKTALVRALTGTDADRLPEEKRRGMTIDLGFAYRRLQPTPEGRDGSVLAFVDVPGHERFIHNMLAGATGIDFVLLAIAADDGPMPQTREHLDIVSLLGVERGVVALTKADLVPWERLAESEAEVREFLAGSVLQDAAILPVSSVTREGIFALGQCLINAAGTLSIREPKGEFRLSIDRSFVLAGVGIVVTGTVAAGSISVGERAVLSPSGIDLRIRGIQAHNRPAQCAQAGQRCALNLAGADLERQRVKRGDWVVAPSLHAPTTRLDTQLRLLHHDLTLKPGVSVHLHLGAARVGAHLMPLTDATPGRNAELPVRLAIDHPIAAWRGDRFILRDASATRTVGGGVVLDPSPPNRGRRRPERLAILTALAQPQPAEALVRLLKLSPTGIDLDRFALSAGLTEAELRMACQAAGARVLKAEAHRYGFAFLPALLLELQHDLCTALGAYHRAAPESPGAAMDGLQLTLNTRLSPVVFRALVQALAEEGALTIAAGSIRLPSHQPALQPAQMRVWVEIRRRLENGGFEALWVRDLARDLSLSESEMRQLMKRLAQMGEVVEVAPDRYYRRQTVHQMAQIVADICRAASDGTVTAAVFRDRIKTGRKLAIIVLEFFDRTGITIRRGDLRKVQPQRLQAFQAEPVNGGRNGASGSHRIQFQVRRGSNDL